MHRIAVQILPAILLLAGLQTSTLAQDSRAERARASRPAGRNPETWNATGSSGMVVGGGQEAVEAGLEVLQAGGNAADATVATLLAETVTDANQFCFGGEVPIMFYDARRRVIEIIVGQGAAPRLATADYFRQRDGISKSGPLAATVPATLDACLTLLERHGTRTFAQSAQPMLRILDRGEFAWHRDLAVTIRRLTEAEQSLGDDRIRGLRLVADYFYRGPIAREIDAWSRQVGALLRYSDLATHVTRIDEPVKAEYRGHTVYKCGAWSQGPYLLEALQLIEPFDLKQLGHNRPDTIHITVEALKLALADRDVHFGDPLFADIPLPQLISREYANLRRPLIDLHKASLTLQPGDPRGGKMLLTAAELPTRPAGAVKDTTTCLVADQHGNVVAATPSGWTGSLAGNTGVWLGSRLQSFNLIEGSPNCLEPGKRPRITLSPTLVLKDGSPRIAVSVAGGDGQDQITLQLLINSIDFGMDPATSVTAPRFETKHFISSFGQVAPELGLLRVNAEIGEQTIADLTSRGHRVVTARPPIWVPTMLVIEPGSNQIRGAGDPKAGRHAAGY